MSEEEAKYRKTIRRYFGPPAYFEYQEDEGYSYLVDSGGFILTREQWEQLRDRVDQCFARNPDDEIEEHNIEKAKPTARPQVAEEPKPKRRKEGYIYLIHGEGTPWYKIGQAIRPTQRIKQLGTQGPFKYNMEVWFKVNDMDEVESFLHRHFDHKRVEGEWFLLNEQDVNLMVSFLPSTTHTVFDVAERLLQ